MLHWYRSGRRSRWNNAPLSSGAWCASLCCRSFFLSHLQSEGGWEPISQPGYCCPSYSLRSCNTNAVQHCIQVRHSDTRDDSGYLLDTSWRKWKKWCRVVTFLSGSTQESSTVAEVRSSSVGSCWALIKASCSSVGSTGSGSSLKNCFTKPATSQGSALDRHSSPASTLAWTSRNGAAVVRNSHAPAAFMAAGSISGHCSPWGLSDAPQSRTFWTGPLCWCVPSGTCTRWLENYEKILKGRLKGEPQTMVGSRMRNLPWHTPTFHIIIR